jgi:hypothetical protein
MRKKSKTAISLLFLFCSLLLGAVCSNLADRTTKLNQYSDNSSALQREKVNETGEMGLRLSSGRRELAISSNSQYKTRFSIARREQTVVIENTFMAEQIDLKGVITLYKSASNDPTTFATAGTKLDFSELRFANTDRFIVFEMADSTSINQEYLFLNFVDKNTVLSSSNKVYQYYNSSANNLLTYSLAMAIVYMALTCCCWVFGVKQFYHLIRIAQMIYMLTLISSNPKSSSFYLYAEDFKYNIFNVIPNPVVISERYAVKCQPAIEFFAEGLSCHAYNSLRHYVLGFLIFIVLMALIFTSKYSDSALFEGLKSAMSIKHFILTIFPDIFIAIYINAVAGFTNGILGLGFLFCLVLILWEAFIIRKIIVFGFNQTEEAVEFLKFFVFSRSSLTLKDRKFGLKVLAVLLEQLKAFIIVTMIALFNTEPRTQMVIIFITYILHAIFLILFRPYTSAWQNFFFALSDICFFILVLLMLISHINFDNYSVDLKENRIGAGQVAMFWIIFFLNIIIYVVPVLKGQDNIEVHHERVGLPHQVDSKVRSEGKDESVVMPNKEGDYEKSKSKRDANSQKQEGFKPSIETAPTKSKDEPLAKVNSIPNKTEKAPELRDSREKKEERNIKTSDGIKSNIHSPRTRKF